MAEDSSHHPPGPEEQIRILVENQELIYKSSDIIDQSLKSNLLDPSFDVNRGTVIYGIEIALQAEAEDELENSHEIAHVVMSTVSNFSEETLNKLRTAGADKDIIRTFTKLSSKYGEESKIPIYRYRDGPNYWNNISSDLVRRPSSETIGMEHRIIRKHADKIELSVSLDSNLALAINLLLQHERAIDEFGEEAINQTTQELIEDLSEAWERISSQHTEED